MIVEAMNMKEHKAYFATEDDYNFFNNGTLSKILIDFFCLFKEVEKDNYVIADNVVEAFKELTDMGYRLFLKDVPEDEAVLDILDETFDYPFCCNDYPTRYTDLSDTWNTVSRDVETRLCGEGLCDNRYFHYEDNWLEIVQLIKENDLVIKTKSSRVIYDDTDWNQKKIKNGLVDQDGNQLLGDEYIEVEKMNAETTKLLKKIAMPRTENPVPYSFKPIKERWYINAITWDINPEIAQKYDVRIEIEQGSLYYRGTWLKICAKSYLKTIKELNEITKQFCSDYGFDKKPGTHFVWGYDLPWSEDQKKRAEEDDNTDWFFDSMD